MEWLIVLAVVALAGGYFIAIYNKLINLNKIIWNFQLGIRFSNYIFFVK